MALCQTLTFYVLNHTPDTNTLCAIGASDGYLFDLINSDINGGFNSHLSGLIFAPLHTTVVSLFSPSLVHVPSARHALWCHIRESGWVMCLLLSGFWRKATMQSLCISRVFALCLPRAPGNGRCQIHSLSLSTLYTLHTVSPSRRVVGGHRLADEYTL